MFDDIYRRYDLLNTILSFGMDRSWRRKTAEGIPQEGTIIDLCGGGGQLARYVLDRRGFRGNIVVADISARMISEFRKSLQDKDRGGSYFAVACDVESLPFSDNAFEAAVSSFSLRNLDNLAAFSREARRVVKKGGRARLLEIGHPRGRILKILFESYFYRLGPLIARLFTNKKYAYDYLPLSLKIFPPQEEILPILSAGWDKARMVEMWKGIAVIYELSKGKE